MESSSLWCDRLSTFVNKLFSWQAVAAVALSPINKSAACHRKMESLARSGKRKLKTIEFAPNQVN